VLILGGPYRDNEKPRIPVSGPPRRTLDPYPRDRIKSPFRVFAAWVCYFLAGLVLALGIHLVGATRRSELIAAGFVDLGICVGIGVLLVALGARIRRTA
jgi:hypothetical protein